MVGLIFLFQAPEELWSQAATLRLELRNLRRLLQLFSESSADLQKLTARLPSPDQQSMSLRQFFKTWITLFDLLFYFYFYLSFCEWWEQDSLLWENSILMSFSFGAACEDGRWWDSADVAPTARELTQRCSKGLLYTDQVKTAITHW